MRRPLVVGNWKMHGLAADLAAFAGLRPPQGCDMALCPPATLIHRAAQALAGSGIAIGGQACHAAASGAHTGDISAAMLADAGARLVILGHSERRRDHGETDTDLRGMIVAAWDAGLDVVLCLGETAPERAAGGTLEVVAGQLDSTLPDAPGGGLALAYEPVWAIGSGRTPAPGEIAEVHGMLRARLAARFGPAADTVRILYGGSVTPANAAAIATTEGVDGALVGGASLDPRAFAAIAEAFTREAAA